MKTYTFNINKNNTSNKSFTFNLCSKSNKTNYSKILDNIIYDNMMKVNPYLKSKKDIDTSVIIFNAANNLNENTEFKKAANFLANYNKMKTFPYIIGKLYKLTDGTPIMFYEDEIQIGHDVYTYEEFDNISFLNTISEPKKKIIIDIFTNGLNVNINIKK